MRSRCAAKRYCRVTTNVDGSNLDVGRHRAFQYRMSEMPQFLRSRLSVGVRWLPDMLLSTLASLPTCRAQGRCAEIAGLLRATQTDSECLGRVRGRAQRPRR